MTVPQKVMITILTTLWTIMYNTIKLINLVDINKPLHKAPESDIN